MKRNLQCTSSLVILKYTKSSYISLLELISGNCMHDYTPSNNTNMIKNTIQNFGNKFYYKY